MSTNANTRIPHLDLIRGIAVLGLLFMNLPSMGLLEIGYVRFTPDILSDQIIAAIQSFLFDGRFRNLFCLLFAIGLYLQYLSYQRQNLNSYVIIKSRLNWLLIFGLIHCVFIWPGDILILYALTGLYLNSKLEWPAQKLIKRGSIFYAIGLIILVLEVSISVYTWGEPVTRSSQDFVESLALIKGNYLEIILMNLMYAVGYIITFPVLTLFYIGGVMLLGLGLFKSGKLQHGFNNNELWLLTLITIIFSAIDAYIAAIHPSTHKMFVGAFGSISGFTMALLIWHFVLKFKLAASLSWLSISLQRVGRMAFSMYILQSLVMAGLFRYALPELNETMTLADYMLIAVAFVLVQMLIARYYLTYFKQGPLEKLWRHLVNRTILSVQEKAQQKKAEAAREEQNCQQLSNI